MRSTGEVLGIADSFGKAFYKSQEAAGGRLPDKGTVFISINDREKKFILEPAKKLKEMGFNIVSTKGTSTFLKDNGVFSEEILKMHEGRPNISDEISSQKISMVINTPAGREGQYDDSYIRKTAVKHKVPYITTIAAANAAVEGIFSMKSAGLEIKSLQDYHG